MREVFGRLWSKRQRFAPLVLIVGVALIAVTLGSTAPAAQNISLRIAHPDTVTQVHLLYTEGGEPMRDETFRFQHGAPDVLRDRCDLSPGRYTLSVDVLRGARGESFTRTLTVDGAASVQFDLTGSQP